MKKEVDFYRKPGGECPVEEFLNSLPDKVAQKVTWTLSLVEDIWEFRIKLGSNIYRVFAFMLGHKVIVTNGFVKKSQKSPVNEIEKAQNYKRDYLSRRN
jgi:phage-related protein